jgi:hypothetical protein
MKQEAISFYISNSSQSNPLIYGEFDNQLLRTTGRLEVTKTLINSTPILQLTEASTGSPNILFKNATANYWKIVARPVDAYEFFIFNYSGTNILKLGGDGDAFVAGTLYDNSDQRYKRNISTLTNTTDKIKQLESSYL